MTTKSRAQEISEWRSLVLGRPQTPEEEAEIVKSQAQRLIEWLYDPDSRLGWKGSSRITQEGLSDTAVNWGDLGVLEVTPQPDGSFLIDVEEAAPDANDFRCWLERRLWAWGWRVRVITEW